MRVVIARPDMDKLWPSSLLQSRCNDVLQYIWHKLLDMMELTTINRHHRYTSIPEQVKSVFYLDTV